MIDSGASFCQVDKIRHDIHDSDVITDGNHIWHGTIPNLRSNEIISIIVGIFVVRSIFIHIIDEDISKILDPKAWAKKYFNIASDSWYLFEFIIIGMNDNIFISSAVQVISQLLLEMAISDLEIIRRYISILNGEKAENIKI